MFSKPLKGLLILVIVGSCVVPAANALAASATVSPGGAVTGTGSTTSEFIFSTARKTLSCTRMDFTATLASASGAYPLTVSSNLKFFCGGTATVTGGVSANIACAATATLNVTGPTAGGATPVTISGISCPTTVVGTTCGVTIGGSLTGSFTNTASRLTISATGQSMTATGSTDGRGGTCSFLPNSASLPFTDNFGAGPVFTVTPATSIIAV